MGDLIWHLPVIRAIAAASQSGRVTLLTKPSTQADTLLAGDPAIDRIVWFDHNPRHGRGRHDGPLGYLRLVATLRCCDLETCVLLHHGASLALAIRLAGIPRRHGYGNGLQRYLLNHASRPGRAQPFTEAFDQANTYAKSAGLWPLSEPAVTVRADWMERARGRLAGLGRPLAVLGIGSHGGDRQWGARNFAALAEALVRRGCGTVLLLAAEHEAGLAQAVCDRAGDGRIVQAVGWPLAEVAGMLSEADLFVGNDSGLMNLRAAVGRPAYALFGASGPLQHSASIRSIVPPGGARAGMDRITVYQVLDRLMADRVM